LPVAAVSIVAVGAVALGVNLASGSDGNGGGGSQTTAVPTAVQTAVPSTSIPMVITLPPTSAPQVIVPSSAVTSIADTASTTTWVQPPLQPVRWVSFENGTFVLRGSVPGQTTGDAAVARFAAGVGAERVRGEYQVVGGAPVVSQEPLYAHDATQFAPGSAVLQPATTQFLDLLAAVLVANPAVTVHVRGYTDGVGQADADLLLSQQRVDAVAAYLASKGVAVGRLTATGFGAAYPVAPDDTEAGRAANQRVEFTLHHLLG
jgi:outer membrane protein OmpA-like peptidoglycan-associated protein